MGPRSDLAEQRLRRELDGAFEEIDSLPDQVKFISGVLEADRPAIALELLRRVVRDLEKRPLEDTDEEEDEEA